MVRIKKGIAILMAALMCVPNVSAFAVETETNKNEVTFNTGSFNYKMVDEETYEKLEEEYENLEDPEDQETIEMMRYQTYDEDGNYTIQLEQNAFFPYEVQFTCGGETTDEWFMTPDDSIEIGGHTFTVESQTDGSVVTQMSFQAGDKTAVVYPEKKTFTDDADSLISTYSLLPLEEKNLQVDLSEFTPLELSRIAVANVFKGDNALGDDAYVMYRQYRYNNNKENYLTASATEPMNLSIYTANGYAQSWEMIVGEKDQLADTNIRYIVNVNTKASQNWLKPVVYTENDGERTEASKAAGTYYDYDSRELRIEALGDSEDKYYVSLAINPEVFTADDMSNIKVYEGECNTEEQLQTTQDITEKIWNVSGMESLGTGYLLSSYSHVWITFVQYDEQDKISGLLPMDLCFYPVQPGISINLGTIYQGNTRVSDTISGSWENDIVRYTYTLYKEYRANDSYSFNLYCYNDGKQDNSKITAAYAAKYDSIAEAEAAGATDIKNQLFSSVYSGGGYSADYSNGVTFSIFVGDDGENQQAFYYQIKTVTGNRSQYGDSDDDPQLSDNSLCTFDGVYDKGQVNSNENIMIGTSEGNDSYGENNYRTIFVKNGTDLKNLALTFSVYSNAKLYAEGSTTAEESGVTTHDFSNGPIHYTVSAENGKNSANYWIQVVKEEEGQKLFVTSLADEASNTTTDSNDVVTSTREMVLDSIHDNRHDILVANIGNLKIPNLKVELESDTLDLNDYWTLTGNHELKAMSDTKKESEWDSGELQNLAKVQLTKKEGIENGSAVSGTLTFKTGETTLLVLNLTGTVGDPCITTKEIPQAVKYVPYGTMIQNSNKYSWNTTSYELISGKLPQGMELKENGELYGVPKETGDFTFKVRMTNSYRSFSSSTKQFTLTVLDNTDTNVDNATDEGYTLSERITDVESGAESYLVVSEGQFGEFLDVYLDGEKLSKDTDYSAESGSTRITIKSQTLNSKGSGRHTIGIEFRTDNKTGEVKKAAQNYTIASHESPSTPGIVTPPSNPGTTTKPDKPSTTKPDKPSTTKPDKPTTTKPDKPSSTKPSKPSTTKPSKPSTTKPSTTKPSTKKPSKPKKESNQPGKTQQSNKTKTSSAKKKKAKKYTVRRGDSFWKLAVKFYGDGTKWTKIYQANKKIVSKPEKLRAGQKITIPAK